MTTADEVLVVGAGPAGLTAAASLARQGVDVLVVEKHAGTSPFPKATRISPRTMEVLRGWGLDERVRAGAMAVEPLLTTSRTLVAPVSRAIPLDEPATGRGGACYCPQDHLEPVLAEHVRAFGGRIRFGTALVALDAGDDGVRAVVRDAAGEQVVEARYVVGADGPRSAVRAAVGVGVEDLGTIGEFVAVTFHADLARRLPRRPAALNSVHGPEGAGLFVPSGAGDRWVYARRWWPERESLDDWTPERCRALLRAGSGLPDLDPVITAVMPFMMGGHLATAFRAGSAFLVGDAAHRTTPVGGIGMNTAIQAAHNLGWKLARVLRGRAGEALLDSYEAERRPVGRAAVEHSLTEGVVLDPGSRGIDLDVRYAPPTPGPRPRPGERAPDVAVQLGGAELSTLDLFDGRLTVLAGPGGDAWARAAAGLTAAGTSVTCWRAGRDLHDDGELVRAYGLGEAGCVLVRPDGFVAWRSEPGATAGVELGEALHRAVDTALHRDAPVTAAAA